MPEGPELFRDALRIQDAARKMKVFSKISYSEFDKWGKLPEFKNFTVDAKSRGKELVLFIRQGKEEHRVRFHNGMTGWWSVYPESDVYKHAHVRLHSEAGVLAWNDERRFGGFTLLKPADSLWSDNRGPDPYHEYEAFAENLRTALKEERKILNKSVSTVLLDQSLFNGVGNYLRAEILGRVEPAIVPTTPLRRLLEEDFDSFALRVHSTFKSVIEEVILGGKPFDEWLSVYGKGKSEKDSSGRTMWSPTKKAKNAPAPKKRKRAYDKGNEDYGK